MGFWGTLFDVFGEISKVLDTYNDGKYSRYSDEELWSLLRDSEDSDEKTLIKSALRNRGYDI